MNVSESPSEMVADHFTKPLQGALFRQLRDAILNIAPEDGPASVLPDSQVHRSVLGDNKVQGTQHKRTWAEVAASFSKK